LSLNRVVLEITEHNFNGDIESLQHLLKYYQTYGIKVAIDNIGKESSNLDRIGLLSPDILKVDLHILRQTAMTQSY
ncbi:EAL domain-containing protein, partial [Escherichia coli]|nr:EAL domain-containing protein [Escherichia coli]